MRRFAGMDVETATAAGNCSGDGNMAVVVTAAGMSGSPITLAIPVVSGARNSPS